MKAIDLFIVCQNPTLYVKLFSGVHNSESWYMLLWRSDMHPSPSGGGGEGVPKGILSQHLAVGVVLGPGMHQPSLH